MILKIRYSYVHGIVHMSIHMMHEDTQHNIATYICTLQLNRVATGNIYNKGYVYYIYKQASYILLVVDCKGIFKQLSLLSQAAPSL